MTSFNFLRRSPIKPSSHQAKERAPWHPQRIRLDATGMASLRSAAFKRSGGICECERSKCLLRPMNLRRVNWYDGQLHHVITRAHGGSDAIENVQFVTRRCHLEITGEPQWSYWRKSRGGDTRVEQASLSRSDLAEVD